jgi:CRP-like cAMP-binding protein
VATQGLTVSATIMAIVLFLHVGPGTVTIFMLAAQPFILLSVLICIVVLITTPERELIKEHFARGATIFRKGEIGDKVYVIENGEVEAVEEDADGGERVIRRMGPGDHFGEIALIRRIPRTLTIRAVSDVDVLAIKAGAFVSLFSHLPVLRDSFLQMMEQRLQATKHDIQRRSGQTESPP